MSFTLNTHTVTRLVLEQINELTHLSPAALAPPPVEALNLDGTPGPKVVRFEKGSYGSNTAGAGKKAVVEFSSPNLGKPFHASVHQRQSWTGADVSQRSLAIHHHRRLPRKLVRGERVGVHANELSR